MHPERQLIGAGEGDRFAGLILVRHQEKHRLHHERVLRPKRLAGVFRNPHGRYFGVVRQQRFVAVIIKVQVRPDQGDRHRGGHTRYSQALVTRLRYHNTPSEKSYIITVLREASRAGSQMGAEVWTHPHQDVVTKAFLSLYRQSRVATCGSIDMEATLNRNELVEFLVSETRSHWDLLQQPLYLADIPSLLREKKSIDYKTILGDQRLKAFSEETSGDSSYLVVKHPFQKAKIGLIPVGESFTFPEEKIVVSPRAWWSPKVEERETNTNRITLEFLKAVSGLTPEEQASIVIPTHIIVKLLNQK